MVALSVNEWESMINSYGYPAGMSAPVFYIDHAGWRSKAGMVVAEQLRTKTTPMTTTTIQRLRSQPPSSWPFFFFIIFFPFVVVGLRYFVVHVQFFFYTRIICCCCCVVGWYSVNTSEWGWLGKVDMVVVIWWLWLSFGRVERWELWGSFSLRKRTGCIKWNEQKMQKGHWVTMECKGDFTKE